MERVKKTLFYLFVIFVAFVFITPLVYLFTTSMTSAVELGDYPKPILPKLTHEVKYYFRDEDEKIVLSRLNNEGEWKDLKSIYTEDYYTTNNKPATEGYETFSEYVFKEFNVKLTPEEIGTQLEDLEFTDEVREFTYRKGLFLNYTNFFELFGGAGEAFVNSLTAALYTIILSLTIGGSLGFALARTKIKGKQFIGIGALVVRMFPTIAISISVAVMLIGFGMGDSMLGISVIYAIPNIGLTAWITKGIFQGVNKELEEASLVFGGTKLQTFFRITFPLVLPAFAASSMYAFITAWNDTGVALLVLDSNKTLSLLLYLKVVGGGTSSLHYAAAGSVLLILPAAAFTFILRKYINQLWG